MKNFDMRLLFNVFAFLIWPFSPKELQPIKVIAPTSNDPRSRISK
jgi:hypothetical protein